MTLSYMEVGKSSSSKGEESNILELENGKSRSTKNQEILTFTCSAFFLFAMAEVVGAYASNSLSLLGDAGAMSIDVFTVIIKILSLIHHDCC